MKRYLIVGFMAVWGMGAASGAVMAADLSYDDGYNEYNSQSGSPYDDPRYASIYGRTNANSRSRDRNYSSTRIKRSYSYSSTRSNRRCDRPNHEAHGHSSDGNYSRTCLSKYQIRRKLKRQGWRGFELIRARRDVAVIKARQLDGDLYKLRVDRCNGEILRARILDSYNSDDYAYRRTRRYKSY